VCECECGSDATGVDCGTGGRRGLAEPWAEKGLAVPDEECEEDERETEGRLGARMLPNASIKASLC